MIQHHKRGLTVVRKDHRQWFHWATLLDVPDKVMQRRWHPTLIALTIISTVPVRIMRSFMARVQQGHLCHLPAKEFCTCALTEFCCVRDMLHSFHTSEALLFFLFCFFATLTLHKIVKLRDVRKSWCCDAKG